MPSLLLLLLLLTTLLTPACSFSNTTVVTLTTPHTKLTMNENSTITVSLDRVAEQDLIFNCTSSSDKLLVIEGGDHITVMKGTNRTRVNVTAGHKGGTLYISTVLIKPNVTNFTISDLNMSVVHSETLETVIVVVGWLCFAAWSISFYPQVFKNCQRKSVVGLSFDFLGYNMLGWICYTAFNFALLWVAVVKAQYYETYTHGVINVQLSDFCFSAHAFILTAFTILQCLCYERGGQSPSTLCIFILSAFACGMLLMLIVAAASCISWFQYVSIFSYVKLAVTLFKYSPQVYVNFKNKSTEAISIYQFLLDLTGGALSLIQMGMIAYNYDDWKTFIGDFTKFGLAALSILYDLIFIVQHYVLYREPRYKELREDKGGDTERLIGDGEGEGDGEDEGDLIVPAPVNRLG